MTAFDLPRRHARKGVPVVPGRGGARRSAPVNLSPEDLPRDGDPWSSWSVRCNHCPAPAVTIMARVIVSQHLDWDTFDAASVAQRHLCGHHTDAAQTGLEDLGWVEVASRRASLTQPDAR